MKTVIIELINDKAEKLLKDLEDVNIIRIVEKTVEIKPRKKPSDYFGILSKEEGEDLLNYVNESRNEWERDI